MIPLTHPASARCYCRDCLQLDAEHPGSGFQLALPARLPGEPTLAGSPDDPDDTPAAPPAGGSAPEGRPRRDLRSRPAAAGAAR